MSFVERLREDWPENAGRRFQEPAASVHFSEATTKKWEGFAPCLPQ
jgi:hypothetical protein